jgi:hypothetical protein
MTNRPLLMATLLLSAHGAWAATPASAPVEAAIEATIPFANRGGINDWQVIDDTHLRLQDSHGQWYLARLQSPARELHFAEQLGFDTAPSGALSRFSVIVVKGQRYPLVSLTRTDPPPKKQPAR